MDWSKIDPELRDLILLLYLEVREDEQTVILANVYDVSSSVQAVVKEDSLMVKCCNGEGESLSSMVEDCDRSIVDVTFFVCDMFDRIRQLSMYYVVVAVVVVVIINFSLSMNFFIICNM